MQADLIYDVGTHLGNDTAYYLAKGYRVVAIEADPQLVEQQRARHTDHIRSGRLTLLNCVIGPENGPVTFWINEYSQALSSFDAQVVAQSPHKHHAVELPGRTMRSILREHGVPFYLKVDIEGSDHYCLSALDPADAPRYVSFEILSLRDLALAEQAGYNSFKCIDQSTLQQLRAPEPSFKSWLSHRLRDRPWLFGLARSPLRLANRWRRQPPPVDPLRPAPVLVKDGWTFLCGDTGPFAEESDGCWQSFEEVAHAWLTWRLDAGKGRLGWFDIHATRKDKS